MVSLQEQSQLHCAACGQSFETQVWSIVDAAERPDLAQALLDGTLNAAACPDCGASNQAQIALLYHDPTRRRAHFAVPSDTPERRWREQAQELLSRLVESLPEEARLPYLDDVHVNQEIAGVRRALLRGPRTRGAKPNFGKPIELPTANTAFQPPQPSQPTQPTQPTEQPTLPPAGELAAAIEQVVAVGSASELHALVARYPQLLSDQADDVLRQFAEEAFNQGDRNTATALHTARTTLANLRAPAEEASGGANSTWNAPDAAHELPDPAYQALLHTASQTTLMDTLRVFPLLIEPWADQEIGQRIEAALDEENERLATVIEERRDALAVLRNSMLSVDSVERAVAALIVARDTDAVGRVLHDYPVLLTDTGQQALAIASSAARTSGDVARAVLADERQAMLQHIRTGIMAT